MRWLCVFVVIASLVASQRHANADEPATWSTRIAWWNDLFAELPPADDSGFTNDFELEFTHRLDRVQIGAHVFHRMITEQFAGTEFPTDRWDQLDLFALGRTTISRHGIETDVEVRLGPSFGGNLGGLAIQDRWHRLSGTGASTDEGLQSEYNGSNRAALVVGASAQPRFCGSFYCVGIGVVGQVAIGSTGLSLVSAHALAGLQHMTKRSRWSISVEAATSRYATDDPNLTLAGAYRTGANTFEPKLTLAFERRMFTIAWQLRGNEGGSGEATGVFSFSLRAF